MDQNRLKSLFAPNSIAVIGASNRKESVGGMVFANLLKGYVGALFPVNPNHRKVQGRAAYGSLDEIQEQVDLAIVATPAETVPEIVESCGRHGIGAVLLHCAGFAESGKAGRDLQNKVLDIARRHDVRIVGPNCLGIMRPSTGLNATMMNVEVMPGHVALVSQSAALCAAVLDCSKPNNIGFSSVINLGGAMDLDFDEALDFLADDPETESVLLYLEGVHRARPFMSALRAASRAKPVVVMKAGRHASGAAAALSRSGAQVGSDAVFDAALQRAGAVRIRTLNQFFSSAKTLSSRFRAWGNRLAVVANGAGPGILAADRASDTGIVLAGLADETMAELNRILPPRWSRQNPVDVMADADAARFCGAVEACLKDPGVDAVLAVLTPVTRSHPLEVAEALIPLAQQQDKPLLACWMGETWVAESRKRFVESRIPSVHTPESGVDTVALVAQYRRNQQMLMQMPGPLTLTEPPEVESARLLIEGVLGEKRKVLSEMESKALLAAFRIPVVNTVIARSANEALALAQQIGFPVAMKVHAHDIPHKTDVGGVRLNLSTPQAVKSAYNEIIASVQKARPDARVEGIAIQPMISWAHGRELKAGIAFDEMFGPVITFGAGGRLAEILRDTRTMLPPLNRFLVGQLIDGAQVARLMGPFRQHPPIDREALENVLLRVSEMACELPWIKELDINPLIVDENGAIAADARIVVDYYPAGMERYGHMAIHPYPTHLVTQWQMPDGLNVTVRPVRPEDAEMEAEFTRKLSDRSRYFRFMGALKELSPAMLLRFTQFDYDREMALVAVAEVEGEQVELGTARYVITGEGICEFAVVVADEWQNRGIGHRLMVALMDAARLKKLGRMVGEVLSTNQAMLTMMESLGFSVATNPEDPSIKNVTIEL